MYICYAMKRIVLIIIGLSLLITACKHLLTDKERQQIGEQTVKDYLDPHNCKKLSDFHFRVLKPEEKGSGYTIDIVSDLPPRATAATDIYPAIRFYLNADCNRVIVEVTLKSKPIIL